MPEARSHLPGRPLPGNNKVGTSDESLRASLASACSWDRRNDHSPHPWPCRANNLCLQVKCELKFKVRPLIHSMTAQKLPIAKHRRLLHPSSVRIKGPHHRASWVLVATLYYLDMTVKRKKRTPTLGRLGKSYQSPCS